MLIAVPRALTYRQYHIASAHCQLVTLTDRRLGSPNVECSGVAVVDISPTILHIPIWSIQTISTSRVWSTAPRTAALDRILQSLHSKMLIHRARVPVRVADQLLDWLLDGLAATRSSIAMTFPLTRVYIHVTSIHAY